MIFVDWLRYLKLRRRINALSGIVPEYMFDYCGHRHTVGHIHSYLYASQFAEGADILDAGCGSGYGTEMLALRGGGGRTTIGVDLSLDAIGYCRVMRKRANLHFASMDGRSLVFRDGSFDLVTSFEVIEHFTDYERFLNEIRRVLRPGGRFVLVTPNGAHANHRLRGTANPEHVHEFTYNELRSALAQYFDDVLVLCRHYRTQEAEEIEHHIRESRKRHLGVQLLTEWSRRARLIHLVLPHPLRDRYFRWRTGYPLHWYGPQHVRLETEYSDDAYAFLATGLKR